MLVQDFRSEPLFLPWYRELLTDPFLPPDIITTAKRIVKDKNSDELAQEFLYNTRNVDYSKGNLKNVDVNTESSEVSLTLTQNVCKPY